MLFKCIPLGSAFTILFIACCVTHFSVLNSIRQFSRAFVTPFVSIVIPCLPAGRFVTFVTKFY
jgi:hypothetical protein